MRVVQQSQFELEWIKYHLKISIYIKAAHIMKYVIVG